MEQTKAYYISSVTEYVIDKRKKMVYLRFNMVNYYEIHRLEKPMPNSITKNKQEEAALYHIIKAFFPDRIPVEWIELTEGFFNVAYSVRFEDGEEMIIKIAPDAEMDVMTHEVNIMFSEVDSLRLVKQLGEIPVPEVVAVDFGQSILSSDYFIMRKLSGDSFLSQQESLSQEEKDRINHEVGVLNRKINEITGTRFGYYGQEDKQGTSWYMVFYSMLKDAINDAARKSIVLSVDEKEIFSTLENDRYIFEEVTTPRLIHWDIWAGNVFVKDGQITGLIDFERCLWGDIFLEAGFRSCFWDAAFLEGYGIKEFSPSQLQRILWYDVYLFIISSLECDYRGYDTRNAYEWGSSMLIDTVRKIKDNQ
jgi:aminoglycoside phosphotransferase (APT) family kinase protein